MTWSNEELYAEAETLIEGSELLRETAASFVSVEQVMGHVALTSALSRDDGLGIGPTGPRPELQALIDAIVSDTRSVGGDLALVADNVERAAREFVRVDDESAQDARRLRDRLEQS